MNGKRKTQNVTCKSFISTGLYDKIVDDENANLRLSRNQFNDCKHTENQNMRQTRNSFVNVRYCYRLQWIILMYTHLMYSTS